MARIIAGWLLLLALAVPVQAQGQGAPGTVVELYTSQGCSSCPPADEMFGQMADQPGVIALALHVDYWDYIGWADSFAQPKFTDRQRGYAKAAGSSTIYTPQVIVGGVDHVMGSDPQAVASTLRRHRAAPPAVALDLARRGADVAVRAPAPGGRFDPPLVVQLVRYMPRAEVTIERGENAGRRITYTNIVTSWARVGDWDGATDLNLTLQAPGGDAVVVILQEPGLGPIRAASVLK